MTPKFQVVYMEDAHEFLEGLNEKTRDKIIYNIDKAINLNDRELLKKLKDEIGEFRTLYNKTHFRLFAFWDKSQTLVISTHGVIKKRGRTPEKEIEKAEQLSQLYFKLKQ